MGDYNDPNTFLDIFVTRGGNNRHRFSSPLIDRLDWGAARQVERPERFTSCAPPSDMLIASRRDLPLSYYVGIQFYPWGDKLGGMGANLLDEHPLKAVVIGRTEEGVH